MTEEPTTVLGTPVTAADEAEAAMKEEKDAEKAKEDEKSAKEAKKAEEKKVTEEKAELVKAQRNLLHEEQAAAADKAQVEAQAKALNEEITGDKFAGKES
jgi:hypothetical protein